MLMLEFVCTFVLLYIVVSLIWPHLRSDLAGDARRHKEVLEAIGKLERQNRPPPSPPPLPTHNSAERARVLALGKIRDGEKRHPVLNTPYVSVAKASERRC
jgi:hypothetical protein